MTVSNADTTRLALRRAARAAGQVERMPSGG